MGYQFADPVDHYRACGSSITLNCDQICTKSQVSALFSLRFKDIKTGQLYIYETILTDFTAGGLFYGF